MKKLLSLLLVISVIFFAGCIRQEEKLPKYSNDIITIENYMVSNRKPYANSSVTIEFYIRNNGDEKVNRTKVHFFDIPNVFNVTQLECEYGDNLLNKGEVACEFKGDLGIEPLDTRKVSITLHVSENINSPLSRKIGYSIEYDYVGYRTANIPIIDGKTRIKPLGKFSQSAPSYGPIRLEFELIPKTEITIDKTVIKEYWGVPNQPFEITFNFNDVVGKAKRTNISKDNFSLKISYLSTSTPCDLTATIEKTCKLCEPKAWVEECFEPEPRAACVSQAVCIEWDESCMCKKTRVVQVCDACYRSAKVVSQKECKEFETIGFLRSTKDILVPAKLVCYFVSPDIPVPEVTASIEAKFSYTYKFEKTETFTIQPLTI